MQQHRAGSGGGLDQARIVRAALELVDQHGSQALSMRKLGNRLGVDPMALYYYVANKSDLFDAMVLAVYDEIEVDSLPWTKRGTVLVADFARRFRAALHRHPEMATVVATRPVRDRRHMRVAEQAIDRLRDDGYTPRQALTLVRSVQAFAIGHVLAEIVEPVGGTTATAPDVGQQIIENDLSTMASAVEGGYRPDEQFETGLTALLYGFEQQLQHGH